MPPKVAATLPPVPGYIAIPGLYLDKDLVDGEIGKNPQLHNYIQWTPPRNPDGTQPVSVTINVAGPNAYRPGIAHGAAAEATQQPHLLTEAEYFGLDSAPKVFEGCDEKEEEVTTSPPARGKGKSRGSTRGRGRGGRGRGRARTSESPLKRQISFADGREGGGEGEVENGMDIDMSHMSLSGPAFYPNKHQRISEPPGFLITDGTTNDVADEFEPADGNGEKENSTTLQNVKKTFVVRLKVSGSSNTSSDVDTTMADQSTDNAPRDSAADDSGRRGSARLRSILEEYKRLENKQ